VIQSSIHKTKWKCVWTVFEPFVFLS
jgi:hypothetical protein